MYLTEVELLITRAAFFTSVAHPRMLIYSPPPSLFFVFLFILIFVLYALFRLLFQSNIILNILYNFDCNRGQTAQNVHGQQFNGFYMNKKRERE